MEIPELVALLETKIRLKMEYFDKAEKQIAMEKNDLHNQMRTLSELVNKLTLTEQ